MPRSNTSLGEEDFATELRQSLATRAAGVRMPPDLLDRAVARNRKRTVRNRLIGASSAAAVVATVAVTALSPSRPEAVPTASPASSPAPAPAPVQHAVDAAYVVQRMAAAELNSRRLISLTQDSGSGTTYTDIATQQQRTVFAAAPYIQMTDVIKNGVWTETTVDSRHKVYSVEVASAKDHGVGVVISSYLPLQDQSNPATAYQAALKKGTMTVVGHRNLGGRDTILLHVKSMAKLAVKPFDNEIWVDDSTYQVVQIEHFVPETINKKTGKPVIIGTDHVPPSDLQEILKPVIIRVSWLAPTSGNLAKLTVNPPAGYTQISWAEMGRKYLAPIS